VIIDTKTIMTELQTLLSDVAAYAKRANVQPASVCRSATNDPRKYDRLKRRIEITKADIAKIRSFMAENPVAVSKGAKGHKKKTGDLGASVQDVPGE
jgi:murein L,D-transpeptidase YafK